MPTTPPTTKSGLFGRGGGRILRVSAVVLLLGAGGFWGAEWIKHRANHVFETDARIAAEMISISSRVGGWVVKRPIAQGDRIEVGALLVKVDSREAEQKLKELEARAAEIRASRETVRAEIQMTESQTRHRLAAQVHRVNAAAAAVASSSAELQRMTSEYGRMKSLVAQKIVSQQRMEKADAELRAAQQAERSAEADLASHRAVLLEIRASGQQAEVLRRKIVRLDAEEARAAAQFAQQQLSVGDRRIVSPISGVVDQTFVDPGEFVRPGQRLALIHDPNKIWIEANIRETDLRDVEVGAQARVRVDAFPGQTFSGEVFRIGDSATSQFALLPNPNPSGNFTKISQRIPIKIRIAQDQAKLRPGMMVEIEIVVPGRQLRN